MNIEDKNISLEAINTVTSLTSKVFEKTKTESSRDFILNSVKNKRTTINGINCLYDGIFEANLYTLKRVISGEELEVLNSKIETVTLSSGKNNTYINFHYFTRIFNL